MIIRVLFLSALIISLGCLSTSAQTSLWNTPASAASLQNPIAKSPASIKEGKDLYQSNCSPCHGEKGKGDGAASSTLNPPPADHTSALVQNESDGSIFWKLSEGHNAMPAYKASIPPNQRWAVVNYIRTLAAKSKK